MRLSIKRKRKEGDLEYTTLSVAFLWCASIIYGFMIEPFFIGRDEILGPVGWIILILNIIGLLTFIVWMFYKAFREHFEITIDKD